MGLVSPTQITDGTTIDASDVNTPINELAGVINGSVDAANLASNAVTTAKIADDAVTAPKWHNPYTFRAYRSTNQAIGSGTATKIVLDAETHDANSNFDITTNRRYDAPVTGIYQINGSVGTTADEPRLRTALYVNGSLKSIGSESTKRGASVSDCIALTASDYVELWVIPSAATTVNGSATTTYLSGFLVNET